jgi:MFS family permease
MADGSRKPGLTAMRFVVGFGVISALGDVVYEGARSVYGPFLASLGATALVVSVVTGGGEAVALGARLLFGKLADVRARRWALALLGYGMTAIAVPLLGLTSVLWIACALILLERLGKAIRSPSKDAMLAQAGTVTGRGWAFAVHEVMDQSGAFIGPLLIAAALSITGAYSTGFLLLAVPGAAAIGVLLWLRRRVPDVAVYEPAALGETGAKALHAPFPKAFWTYTLFTTVTMLGFATFGLLSFHLVTATGAPAALAPILYAAAMAVDAVAALLSGRWYDRIGIRGLFLLPLFALFIPWFGFSASLPLAIIGILAWGAAMGIQESTMRAAVADLVPDARRGSAYGVFTSAYGLAWLGGSLLIGLLYEQSLLAVMIATTVIQLVALAIFFAARPYRHHEEHLAQK